MIYFSELLGKKVVSEDNITIGKLEDIIFSASSTKPFLTKIVVRTPKKEKLIIPITFLKKINNNLSVAKDYIVSTLEENELFLVKNLLDKQIIDIKGNKIIRVNDVAIHDKGEFYIIGVDVGILGIFRWLKLENLIYRLLNIFGVKLTSKFLSWSDIQPLELVHGEVKLRKKEEKLEKIRPEDLADYLERTNIVNVRKFLRMMNEQKAAEVIAKLNLNYQTFLFKHYSSEKSAKIINFIEPDEAVDILLTLSAKKREEILRCLPNQKKNNLLHLIKYSTTSIGKLMTTEFMTATSRETASEIISRIKKETTDFYFLQNIYVINDKKQLIGVFNLHELLLQDQDTPVYKFMIQNIIVTHMTTPVEIALSRMIKYRLTTLPVVDKNNTILGVVTIDDLGDYILKNKR